MKSPKRFLNLIKEESLGEVEKWLHEVSDGECGNITNIRIEDQPKGEYQGEGEYCLQRELATESGCYAYEGTYYHKVEDSKKYIAYDYFVYA